MNIETHRSQQPRPAVRPRVEPDSDDGTPQPGSPRSAVGEAIDATRAMIQFSFNEAAALASHDPALGVRTVATQMYPRLLDRVDSGLRDGMDVHVQPAIQGLITGANVYRAVRTYRDPNSGVLAKGLDTLRVATDLMGVAGAVLRLVKPSQAALGETLLRQAYAFGLASHALRAVEHGAERVQFHRAKSS